MYWGSNPASPGLRPILQKEKKKEEIEGKKTMIQNIKNAEKEKQILLEVVDSALHAFKINSRLIALEVSEFSNICVLGPVKQDPHCELASQTSHIHFV